MPAAPDSLAPAIHTGSFRAPADPAAPPRLADTLLIAIVLVIYASVVLTSYGFLDDYPILAAALQHDPEYRTLNQSMGRPVAGWIMDHSFGLVGSVAGLRWLRLAAILGFALVAVVIRRLASRAGWDLWSASCLALLFVTLPSAQVYVSWATLWFYPYLVLLVAGALLLLDATPAASPRRNLRRFATAALAILMLTIVGLAYQPMMFLFVALFMLRHWATPTTPLRFSWTSAALHGTVLAIATIICFGIYKLGSNPSFRGAFPTHWLAKASWFIQQPLVNSLNLFYININNHPTVEIIAVLVAAVIFRGTFIAFSPLRPRSSAYARALLLPAAIVASYAPNLIVVESWPTFRSTYCLYCMSLVAVVWGLYHFLSAPGNNAPRRWRVVSGSITTLACLLALVQCYTLFALPQHNEYDILTQRVAGLPLKPGDRILLVQPELTDTPTWTQLFEEFGTPSTSASWVPRAMVWLALQQTHPTLPNGKYTIPLNLSSESADPANPAPPPDYIIDMKSTLYLFRRR